MSFEALARSLNAEINKSSKRPKFIVPCPVVECKGTLTVKDFGDDTPALICTGGCSTEAVASAIKRLQAQPKPPASATASDNEAGGATPHPSPAVPTRTAPRAERKLSTSYAQSVDNSKVEPQDIEAEQAVLGSVFLDNEAFNVAKAVLSVDDFYWKKHRIIFQTMCDITAKGKPIDLRLLIRSLKSENHYDEMGGESYLMELVDCVPTSAHQKHYSEIVRDMSVKRRVASEMTGIVEMARNGVSADALVGELQRRAMMLDVGHASDPMSRSVEFLTLNEMITRSQTRDRNRAVVDGWLNRKEISLWSGKVEAGKTTLLRQLVLSVLRGDPFLGRSCVKSPVLYLMLDADGEALTLSEFTRLGIDPSRDPIQCVFDPSFSGRPRSLIDLRKKMGELQPGLCIIDPLARFMPIKDMNSYEVTYVMATISDLAKEFDCHFAIPHHIPRGRHDDADAGTAGLGSIAVGGSANARFVCTRKTGGIYTLRTSKGKGVGFVPLDDEVVLKRDEATGAIDVEGVYSWKQQAAALEEQAFQAIDRSEEPLTAAALSREIGCQRSIAGAAANSLFRANRVAREGKGKGTSAFKYSRLVQISLANAPA